MAKTEQNAQAATSAGSSQEEIRRFEVGEWVDVLCDHDREGKRVRDWLQGVVVQADYKMVAVQFVEDVYLTGGWMVPDHVLWCQQGSDVIRPTEKRRRSRKSSNS
jgi:hypothetical protein